LWGFVKADDWILGLRAVAKLNNRRLRLLRFARNDKEKHFLSLRGVPIYQDDEAISALATGPQAGMTSRTRPNMVYAAAGSEL
jgi:hypothetical protein